MTLDPPGRIERSPRLWGGDNVYRLAIEITADVLNGNFEYCLDRVWRVVRHMGAEDDIIEAQQWMVINQGFFGKDIKPGASKVTAAQRFNQGRLVNQASPRGIAQRSPRLEFGDFIGP